MGGGSHGGGNYSRENGAGVDRTSMYEKVSFKQKVKLVKQSFNQHDGALKKLINIRSLLK